MKINTSNFGEISIDREKIINFKEGIPGFKDEKEFIIVLNEDKDMPLNWLQSVNNPDLSFIIVNPFEIYKDYSFDLPDSAIKKLEIEDEKDIVVYTLVVVPEDIKKMTTNLIGPIVINIRKKLGKQVILEDKRYSTKHYIINQGTIENSKGGR